MTGAPRFSVVIPTRDTREVTLACLAALRQAVGGDAEVIVVDDGSSDGTAAAVARAWPAVRVLVHAEPQGFTGAANAGLGVATGALLLLLNSDTAVAPDAIGTLAAAFDADPRLGAAGAALVGADGRPQWSGGRAPTPGWLFLLASGAATALARLPGWRRVRPVSGAGTEVEWASGAALMLRAAAWRAVGPLDARFALYAQDTDLCLRLRDAGWGVRVVAGARVVHQGGVTVGALAGAAAGVHAAHLYTDLVALAAKRGGSQAAARARRALVAGLRLRLALSRIATRRGALGAASASASLTAALAALRRTDGA